MDTKDQLVSSIRDWIQVDNEMRSLQERIKKLRKSKKDITGSLVDVMKSNEIDCFDINDGKLIYSKTRVKKPINKDYLNKTLTMFFENDKERAAQLSKFLLEQREEKITESIRRKIVS
jgi:uncharacterized protein (UPF0335 family)